MRDRLWQPSPGDIEASNMTAFRRFVEKKTGRTFSDYEKLHAWSVDNLELFWRLFAGFTELLTSGDRGEVLRSKEMPGAVWFPGLKLNYTENLLARPFEGTAIDFVVESPVAAEGYEQRYSFGQLRILVGRCSESLRRAGIEKGDRVAGYIANVPEAVVACLACASIGAVWSSASPDFGIEALCARLQQVEPKLLFAGTHYRYGGKTFGTARVVSQLRDRIPSIRKIVSVPYPVGDSEPSGDIQWKEFLGEESVEIIEYERFPFAHPLFILFSSGTTGAPKCMLHGGGGTLLQHRKELQLHCGLGPGDRLLFFTTLGWMMWNWQLSALSLGATICLYDGNPGFPDLSAIWRVVERIGATHFGASGRFLESCMKEKPALVPQKLCRFENLRALLYTGSPLSEAGFRWVYENVKQDLHLAGISGGTDIVSCFILGNPNLPVHAGEIQCKGLGVDVVAYDEQARVVHGRPGELVCRKPIPSMPVAFLNDPGGKKYRRAYFNEFPGVWRHGDYVEFTETGGAVVYGRSDATLNPGGVRIGSAEIYSALDGIEQLTGSVVVGWAPPGEADEVIVLLVVLADGCELDAGLKSSIRTTIRRRLSPRHVPRHIFKISEAPVTRSGKPVELSVKAVLAGRAVANRSALANPHVLDEVEHMRGELLSA